jgi:hypothetical protein
MKKNRIIALLCFCFAFAISTFSTPTERLNRQEHSTIIAPTPDVNVGTPLNVNQTDLGKPASLNRLEDNSRHNSTIALFVILGLLAFWEIPSRLLPTSAEISPTGLFYRLMNFLLPNKGPNNLRYNIRLE